MLSEDPGSGFGARPLPGPGASVPRRGRIEVGVLRLRGNSEAPPGGGLLEVCSKIIVLGGGAYWPLFAVI